MCVSLLSVVCVCRLSLVVWFVCVSLLSVVHVCGVSFVCFVFQLLFFICCVVEWFCLGGCYLTPLM